MGVYRGVAVAGEMLQTRYYSRCLVAFNCSSGKTGNLKRVFAKRANADHGVCRIVVDINDGSQVHIDTQRVEFLSRCLGHIMGKLLRAGSTQRHVSWKYSRAFAKAAHEAVFLVNGNE